MLFLVLQISQIAGTTRTFYNGCSYSPVFIQDGTIQHYTANLDYLTDIKKVMTCLEKDFVHGF